MYPFIYFFGRKIGSYGILMVVGIFLAGAVAWKRCRERKVSGDDLLIIAAFALLVGLPCGSFLYAAVTYPLPVIWQRVIAGDFSAFGGLVFYGSLIGGVIGGLLGAKVAKCCIADVEYGVIPAIPLGHAVGRVGCVMAGCCNGMPYDGPFAFYYPNSVAGLSPQQGYFPVQLLEAILNSGIFGLLYFYSKKRKKSYILLAVYLLLYGISRFSLEFLRGDSIRGIYGGLSLSQWIAGAMVLGSICFILLKRKHAHI